MSLRRRLMTLLLPVLLVLVTVWLVMQLFADQPQVEVQPSAERVWPVETVAIVRGQYQSVLNLRGFVEAPRSAQIRAAVAADVVEMPVREGVLVEAGEGLVRLDATELDLTVRQREADLADLEARLDLEQQRIANDRESLVIEDELLALTRSELLRVQNLATDEYSSQADVDRVRRSLQQQVLAVNARRLAVGGADARLAQARAAIARAEALLAQARLDRDRALIRAPFAGRVASVAVAPGDRVTPGVELLRLYDVNSLEIRAPVLRTHLPAVRAALTDGALPGTAEVDGQHFPVSLSRLGGESAPGRGGIDALLTIEDPVDLVPGRFAEVELRLPVAAPAVLLPYESLYQTDRVFRISDGRLEAVPVRRLGEAPLGDGRRGVLVDAGRLQPGDLVVATQLPQAIDGLRVRSLSDQVQP